jgi:hypothetical protein
VTSVAALCGDGRLLDAWRREGFAGAVHSVFDRVVNLVDASGTLVSLAARGLDIAPGTLRVDVASFAACALRAGMPASARGAMLHVDGDRFAARFDGTAAWHAQLPAYPRDDTTLRDNLGVVRTRLAAAARGSCDALPGVAALIEMRAQALVHALRRGDVDEVCAQGRALLGLGPGLTPSGDDFLVGLFAVLNLPDSPCHGLRRACDAIVADAPSRTNPISLAALREAAQGRIRDSVQTLLCALLGGQRDDVVHALARVLAIGSTSGRDMVSGIVCGLDADVQARAPLW